MMQAEGNGNPMQCVANLIQIVRGECVYDRIKGIDPSFIDQPISVVKPLIIADARWLIKTYEPRISADDIDIEALIAVYGDFKFNIQATLTGG